MSIEWWLLQLWCSWLRTPWHYSIWDQDKFRWDTDDKFRKELSRRRYWQSQSLDKSICHSSNWVFCPDQIPWWVYWWGICSTLLRIGRETRQRRQGVQLLSGLFQSIWQRISKNLIYEYYFLLVTVINHNKLTILSWWQVKIWLISLMIWYYYLWNQQ